MLKGSRFIWYYWSQAKEAKWLDTEHTYVFKGAISAFRFINKKCTHYRTLVIAKNDLKWIVEDEVTNARGLTKSQIWHHDDFLWQFITITEKNEVLAGESMISYNSDSYGQKKIGKATLFLFEDKIKTTLLYKEID